MTKHGAAVYAQTSFDYYRAAINLSRNHFAPRKLAFVVTSDDLPTARSHLAAEDVNFMPGTPHSDLALLAACGGLIIGPSTLGWWAAYLNPHAQFVISPRDLFNSKHQLNRGVAPLDYFPPGWTLLPNSPADRDIAAYSEPASAHAFIRPLHLTEL